MTKKEERKQFRAAVNAVLEQINPDFLSYNEKEYWMIQSPYEYIEYYAVEHKLFNTAIALPLARGLHDGGHRKSSIVKDGITFRLPYVIHCLIVCRILLDVSAPLPHDEEDILLASALCHDMIEDIPFPNHGKELITHCHLDPRVYETVRLVSKRKGFTLEEEKAHFQSIMKDRLALLVKLSDRSHNVEDLYNMSVWKVHEYIDETKNCILPMCEYGLSHYPDLVTTLKILQDKIISLTQASVVLVDRYEARERELREEVRLLKEENQQLRSIFMELWGG